MLIMNSSTSSQGAEKQYVEKKYDLAIVIGRCQLPSKAHAYLFARAAALADKVLFIKGSSYQPRTVKNPFTAEEISGMVRDFFKEKLPNSNLFISCITDSAYSDNDWLEQVQREINFLATEKSKVSIVGHKKDATSYYLDMFPQYAYESVEEMTFGTGTRIDSTVLRHMLYTNPRMLLENSLVPVMSSAREFLKGFVLRPEYTRLVEEYKFLKEYEQKWGKGPFVTVDALIIKCGHILMIKRLEDPGKDLWALPGGFLEAGETILAGALREVNEETSIDVPPAVLRGALTDVQVFDKPDRSLAGHRITHAHKFELDGNDKKPGLPKVRPESDAKEVRWIPITSAITMTDITFEDHNSIIRKMV